MPRGVHNGRRGKRAKTDAERIRDGEAPRGITNPNTLVGEYKSKTKKAKLTLMTQAETARALQAIKNGQIKKADLNPPEWLSKGAQRVWVEYVDRIPIGHLVELDLRAFGVLCEDEALLEDLYRGMHEGAKALAAMADENEEDILTNPLTFFSTSREGTKVLYAINLVSARASKARAAFGFDPNSRLRLLEMPKDPSQEQADELEAAIG